LLRVAIMRNLGVALALGFLLLPSLARAEPNTFVCTVDRPAIDLVAFELTSAPFCRGQVVGVVTICEPTAARLCTVSVDDYVGPYFQGGLRAALLGVPFEWLGFDDDSAVASEGTGTGDPSSLDDYL
jgi:hypothetical protein